MKHHILKLSTSLLMLVLVGHSIASGQNSVYRLAETRTISIENGKLFIDGKLVPADHIPKSFDVSAYRGATKLSFTSDGGDAYVDFNGSVFRLSGDRLVEAGSDAVIEDNSTVFFSSSENGIPLRFIQKGNSYFDLQGQLVSPSSYSNAVLALREKADEMHRLRVELVEDQSVVNPMVVRRLADEAETTAKMAMNLTHLDAQGYLQEIRESDLALYQRLLRERELEMESYRLADAIRSTPPAQRKKLETQLRDKLEEAFRFKQENREREIQQLSLRLQKLQQQVEQREKLKNDIVEARFTELVKMGSSRD